MTMFNQQPAYGTPQQQRPAAPAGGLPGLDQIMSGGTPGAFGKDDPIGTSVRGTITLIEARQQTDFDTSQPKYFDDGQPMMQVVIHLQTDQRDPMNPADDGQRAIYVKGKNIAALRNASQSSLGAKFPAVGDGLVATFAQIDEPKKRGYNGAKLYTYQLTKGAGALDQAMSQTQPSAAEYAAQQLGAPAPQPVAPQMPVAQQQAPAAAPAQPAFDANQVRQLATLGKNLPEIAALTGARPDQIQPIIDQVRPAQPSVTPMGSEQVADAF